MTFLISGFDSCIDLVNGYGVGLGNDEGDAVLRCASVDALGIPYIL